MQTEERGRHTQTRRRKESRVALIAAVATAVLAVPVTGYVIYDHWPRPVKTDAVIDLNIQRNGQPPGRVFHLGSGRVEIRVHDNQPVNDAFVVTLVQNVNNLETFFGHFCGLSAPTTVCKAIPFGDDGADSPGNWNVKAVIVNQTGLGSIKITPGTMTAGVPTRLATVLGHDLLGQSGTSQAVRQR